MNPTNIFGRFAAAVRAMRPTEKFIFSLFVLVLAFSGGYILNTIYKAYTVEVPVHGGRYEEGIIGYARFINPVLSYTDADKDVTALVYSGLLKATPEGKLMSDLTESWNVSEDGLTYTFTLKPGLTFHDGKPLTTDDIEFTIQKIMDPAIKSPKADSWAGVSVVKNSPTEIQFVLKKPYAPFLENMTLGILPKHIWSGVPSGTFDVSIYNREPIGSGPFKIRKAYRNDAGIYEYYDLIPFNNYALGEPYIKHFVVRFYKSEAEALDAYRSGSIHGLAGISPESANTLRDSGSAALSTPLPRIFALFFNQSEAPVLVNKEVRQALDASIDRTALIGEILGGWGAVANSAIPRGLGNEAEMSATVASAASLASSAEVTGTSSTALEVARSAEPATTSTSFVDAGRKILEAKGWKLGEDGVYARQTKTAQKTTNERLSFSISTSNVPELKRTAELLRDAWTALGAEVKIEIFEPSDLTQKVIRPRQYNSLLFGNVIGRDLDLYPFWHSSQRNDPGLNIASYTNLKADKALETIRSSSNEESRLAAFRAFDAEVRADIPAIFLYSPDFIYATHNIENIRLSDLTSPAERFMSVHEWYTETERVWKIFARNQENIENNSI